MVKTAWAVNRNHARALVPFTGASQGTVNRVPQTARATQSQTQPPAGSAHP